MVISGANCHAAQKFVPWLISIIGEIRPSARLGIGDFVKLVRISLTFALEKGEKSPTLL